MAFILTLNSSFSSSELYFIIHIQLKDDTKFAKTFNTLNLFAYGNYTQYNRKQVLYLVIQYYNEISFLYVKILYVDGGSIEYISLNALQMKKLRMLSLVSIAESNKVLLIKQKFIFLLTTHQPHFYNVTITITILLLI